jgi:hypothetical protein
MRLAKPWLHFALWITLPPLHTPFTSLFFYLKALVAIRAVDGFD